MNDFAQLFDEETITISYNKSIMPPLYGIVTEAVILHMRVNPSTYPFSLASVPDRYGTIGWKTTPNGEIALFERNLDNTVSVEVRTCRRAPGDIYPSFAGFKARQSWRDALKMGHEEYQWLLARSDYALRCNCNVTVQDERPQQTEHLQLLTQEQERELYRDWQYPLLDLGHNAEDENRNEATTTTREATPPLEQADHSDAPEDDSDFGIDLDDDLGDNTSLVNDTGTMFSIAETEASEDATLMGEDDEEIDDAMSSAKPARTNDFTQEMHADVIGTSYYDPGDYAFVFYDAGVTIDAGSPEPVGGTTLRDADGEGMEMRTFKVEPVPPSPPSKETKRATPRKATVKAGKAAMSLKPPKKSSSRVAKSMPSKAVKAPKVLSSQWKCLLCPFRPTEGKESRHSLERHMKDHEVDRRVCVCFGAGGCGKLYTRSDAHTRHLKDKKCHGECIVMRKSAYLEKFPGNEKRLEAKLKKRRKYYA